VTHVARIRQDGQRQEDDCGGADRQPDPPPYIQRATLIGLGLNKMHKRRTLIDSPQVRGMVAKISHLVRIVDDEAGA